MQRLVRALVAEKDAFDASGRKLASRTLLKKLQAYASGMVVPEHGWSAVFPAHFIRIALPFSTHYYHYDEMEPVTVDPGQIVSGTYNDYSATWYFTPSPPEQTMDWSDGLATEENKYSSQSPRVCQIGSLPLFVALEGKNRVELFKRHKRPMKVLVTPTPYPAASDLTLYRSLPFGIYSLAYRGHRVVLPFPERVGPILKKYGVAEARCLFSVHDLVDLIRTKRSICRYQMRQ
tara:strand:+ start:1354 stop:2052 length:699 start_codon:yes stop_codon:yes gene_type:complete